MRIDDLEDGSDAESKSEACAVAVESAVEGAISAERALAAVEDRAFAAERERAAAAGGDDGDCGQLVDAQGLIQAEKRDAANFADEADLFASLGEFAVVTVCFVRWYVTGHGA